MDRLLSGCHPAVSFSYFALVIACAMFFMHPLCLALSLLGAGCCAAQLLGGRGLRQRIVWLLPMALLAALVNPAFVHQGATILTYFPSGNPLTLESILYGCASGVLLAAVVLWFVCVTDVITSDKVVYLFGRIIPAAADSGAGAAPVGAGCRARLCAPAAAGGHAGVLHRGHMEPGKRPDRRRQYARSGLRPAGAHRLRPVPP